MTPHKNKKKTKKISDKKSVAPIVISPIQTTEPAVAKHVERLSTRFTKNIGSPASVLIHTVLFAGIFLLRFFGVSSDQIMLILTTVVSLEAIYLSIFIQMTVNQQALGFSEVKEQVKDIQEDIEEIGENIEELDEDLEEIGEDVEDISEEIEEDDKEDAKEQTETMARLQKIESTLEILLKEIKDLEKRR
jgi:methyl-accepting chemotaxis protein